MHPQVDRPRARSVDRAPIFGWAARQDVFLVHKLESSRGFISVYSIHPEI